MVKILVVEDDETLSETIAYNLRNQAYEVITAVNGRQSLTIAREQQPDLILLDVMLPGMNGHDVCRILRKESSVPIIMLTARSEEIDKIVGLEVGADDYITKPFSMRELMARVKAMLRRVELIRDDLEAQSPPIEREKSRVLLFDNLAIDPRRREVRLAGEPIRMNPKEFELLLFLAQHRGTALSRSLILERVWGWTFEGDSRTVDVHVRWLRGKFGEDGDKRIVTVRGIGYRFDG